MHDDSHPLPPRDDSQRPQSPQNAEEFELVEEDGDESDVDRDEVEAVPRIREVLDQAESQPFRNHFRHENRRQNLVRTFQG